MDNSKIRNIAIIAHVDHGKTTLVDQFFKQSGTFRSNQAVDERIMDSMDLEKERGITITSKNGSFIYKDHLINIIDTPGHADFGGQVERILQMADAALLLVDAAEGPMPQTYFVLKKALYNHLPIMVVVNKIDKPNARCDWAINQVFDLFVKLNAPDHILDFPIIYASAKEGFATTDPTVRTTDMTALFDAVVNELPPPKGKDSDPLSLLISSIDYSPFLGRLGLGKITGGKLVVNKDILIGRKSDTEKPKISRISKIYRFQGANKVETTEAFAGEIVAVAGSENISVGETITDPVNPVFLHSTPIDPPTITMDFYPNDSPFYGKEGKFVSSRHLRERLFKETLSDIALVVEENVDSTGFKVAGRGELHLSILIEKMRREGYELQVSRPRVILKEVDGKTHEPFEELTIDVDENYLGNIIEIVAQRKGIMLEMMQEHGLCRIKYKIPTRGLLGFRNEFLTETRGMGVMNYVFLEYDLYCGDMKNRKKGVLIAMDNTVTVAYALFNLQERGRMFYGPQVDVYQGQIVGEHSRDNDLVINIGKTKKLTNMRAAGSDENIILTPPVLMTLEDCICYINDDELVEITPASIRLRKKVLSESERKRLSRL